MIPRIVPGQMATIAFVGTTPLFGLGLITQTHGGTKPGIPNTWDDAAIEALEVPLANPVGSPKHISADYCYNIPVRPIYKQYPVYAPGREPAGYTHWLKKQKPVIVMGRRWTQATAGDRSGLDQGGELVFDAYVFANPGEGGLIGLNDVRSNAWYQSNQMPVTPKGVLPFLTYVIREKGKIELGSFSCGMCHTRVLPGGAVLKGAQGNFPLNRALAHAPLCGMPTDAARAFNRSLFAAPWLQPDPIDQEQTRSASRSGIAERLVRFARCAAG